LYANSNSLPDGVKGIDLQTAEIRAKTRADRPMGSLILTGAGHGIEGGAPKA
jgi:hypothetical protein